MRSTLPSSSPSRPLRASRCCAGSCWASQLAVPVLTWTALMSAQIVGGFLFLAASGAEVPVPVAVVVSVIGLLAAALVAVPAIGAQAPVVSAPGTKRVEVV
jgi:hypothetical protein